MFSDCFQEEQSQIDLHDIQTQRYIMHIKDQIIKMLQAMQKFILNYQITELLTAVLQNKIPCETSACHPTSSVQAGVNAGCLPPPAARVSLLLS